MEIALSDTNAVGNGALNKNYNSEVLTSNATTENEIEICSDTRNDRCVQLVSCGAVLPEATDAQGALCGSMSIMSEIILE